MEPAPHAKPSAGFTNPTAPHAPQVSQLGFTGGSMCVCGISTHSRRLGFHVITGGPFRPEGYVHSHTPLLQARCSCAATGSGLNGTELGAAASPAVNMTAAHNTAKARPMKHRVRGARDKINMIENSPFCLGTVRFIDRTGDLEWAWAWTRGRSASRQRRSSETQRVRGFATAVGAVTGDGLSGSEIGLTGPRELSNLRTFVRQQNVPLTCAFRSVVPHKRPRIS